MLKTEQADNLIELTILMPCLNEEKTIGSCIDDAMAYLFASGCKGEVLIADNGSSDNSVYIAESKGARVTSCPKKGYGNALIHGIVEARGKYIIMGDCDMSYDFTAIGPMHQKLKEDYDLVMGNRFACPPEKEAMSLSHRMGVPFLSWLARKRYGCGVSDFHCGLRGFKTDAVRSLGLKAEGMEFATEVIGKAAKNGLKITQVPVTLRPDGREGPSHLRTVRDGLRHLILILKG